MNGQKINDYTLTKASTPSLFIMAGCLPIVILKVTLLTHYLCTTITHTPGVYYPAAVFLQKFRLNVSNEQLIEVTELGIQIYDQSFQK